MHLHQHSWIAVSQCTKEKVGAAVPKPSSTRFWALELCFLEAIDSSSRYKAAHSWLK